MTDMEKALDAIKEYLGEIGGIVGSYNRDDTRVSLTSAINQESTRITIAEDQAGIVGLLIVIKVPSVTNFALTRVVEVAWYSSPKMLKKSRWKIMKTLLEDMELWAKNNKADSITIGARTSNSVSGQLLKRGYSGLDINMTREV